MIWAIRTVQIRSGAVATIEWRVPAAILTLTADERAIVEGDLAKLDGLIRKLDDVPTLDGRTPSQIEA
ncbi:site-specific recombinase, phage integrase family protein, partial [Pseudomonas syringae pv. actinidiae ICMP 19079]